MTGYNYRMPNLNAALLLAQLEKLGDFIISKRNLAHEYEMYFKSINYDFEEPKKETNYWLNSILLKDRNQRDQFLEESNLMVL